MFPDLSFASNSHMVTTAAGALFALGAVGAAAAVFVPKLSRIIVPQAKETRLPDFLPFDSIQADGRTVVCKDGSFCRFIAVTGFDQSFLTQEDARVLLEARKRCFDQLAESNVIMRIFTMRDPMPVGKETGFPNEIAEKIAETWNANFKRAFATRSVIALHIKGSSKRDREMLEEAENVITSTLSKYNPVPLSQNPETSPSSDLTIGTFLGRIASPVSRPRPAAFGSYLSEAVAADEVEFLKSGRIVFRSGEQVKYGSVIGIRRLGDETTTVLSGQLSALTCESTILQTVEVISKTKAMMQLQHQKQMMGTTSFSPQLLAQFDDAISLVEGMDEDKASLCAFSETIFLYAETEAELAEAEKAVRQIFTSNGLTSVIEKGVAQTSWFMQFPSFDTRPRVYKLMSTNCAQLATFDRPPSGLPKSDWGPGPIARFYTGSSSVYEHQFHISTQDAALGHGVVIAPTGAGKTVLLEFLSMMASRHRRLKQFMFDRFHGQYVYTTAMGGQYLSFNGEEMPMGVDCGMNPLMCEPTNDNLEFLKTWLVAISGCDDPDSMDQISLALDVAFNTVPTEERSLATIYDLAFTPGSELHTQLRKWVDPSQYGRMFNAERDAINLDGSWLTTFDMTQLLDDPVLGGATVSYMMHRIRETMRRNNAPGLVMIDETEPLLRNPHFRTIFMVMQQELRKLSGVVLSVFQRPEALNAQGVSEVVRQQCGTFYLFQNPSATAHDYREFELTDRELGFVLGKTEPARRMERAVLIKRPMTRESVIVDVDLSPLGRHLKVFSSTNRDVELACQLQRQFGADWVSRYLHPEAP